jgi:hypothetical protein
MECNDTTNLILLLRDVNDCGKVVETWSVGDQKLELTILILKQMVEPNLLAPSVLRA